MPDPTPKPYALKKLLGNPGKEILKDDAPKFELLNAQDLAHLAPEYLTPAATDKFLTWGKQLCNVGILQTADVDALAAYAQAWDWMVQADKHIAKEGIIVKGRKNQAFNVRKECVEIMNRVGSQFGWSPATRERLHIRAAEHKESKWSAFG